MNTIIVQRMKAFRYDFRISRMSIGNSTFGSGVGGGMAWPCHVGPGGGFATLAGAGGDSTAILLVWFES